MTATAPAAIRRLYEMARRRCRTLAATRVLDYLYWCVRRFGRATPSRTQIATATGYTERTVTRAVAELEGAGTLKVWRDRPHCADGTWRRARTNLYRLTWPPRDAKSLVAPRGHGCHIKAAPRSDRTVAAATGGAAAPPPPLSTTLLDVREHALSTPELELEPIAGTELELEMLEGPPVAPTWVRLGMTRVEWYQAGRPERA